MLSPVVTVAPGVALAVVREHIVSGLRRVIVGTSGSPGSLPALRYAESLARRDDAQLIAVHAWLPPGGDLSDRRHPSPYMRRLWTEVAQQRLEDALELAWAGIPAGLSVQGLVVRGEPGPVLVDVASRDDDLLVVGAGRRSTSARLWRGHVSRYCLARARCPVMAVPPAGLPRPRRTGWSLRRRELTVEQALAESVSAEPGQDRR
jgi:nucleotide-binding universal stress UspA family protein